MAPLDEVIESIRLTLVEGNPWPCFVFPDHSVPNGAIGPRPSSKALPVLILKRLVFVWRNRDELAEIDPYEVLKFGGERRQAFEEAKQYNNLDYYHSLVWHKQAAQNLDLEDKLIVLSDDDDDDSSRVKPRKHLSLEDITPATKKGSYSSVFKRPGLPSPSPTPTKKSKPSSKFGSSLPFTEDGSDDELPHPSTFTITPKPAPKPAVTPWKSSGKKFKIPANDYVTRKQLELHMTEKRDGEPSPEVKVIEPVNDPLKVNIYVGDEKKLFIVDRAVIQKCPSIMKQITGDNKTGFEIRNAMFNKFNPAGFESLVSWLKTADYTPRLIEGDYPHLKDVKSANQFDEAAEAASILWNIAHKLDLTELQQLIYRKIEVQTPLATNSLLMMTRMVFWNTSTDAFIDEKMRQMLRQNIATRLHEILEEEPLLFSRVVKSDTELAHYIWTYQIEHPWEESPEKLSESGSDDAGEVDDD